MKYRVVFYDHETGNMDRSDIHAADPWEAAVLSRLCHWNKGRSFNVNKPDSLNVIPYQQVEAALDGLDTSDYCWQAMVFDEQDTTHVPTPFSVRRSRALKAVADVEKALDTVNRVLRSSDTIDNPALLTANGAVTVQHLRDLREAYQQELKRRNDDVKACDAKLAELKVWKIRKIGDADSDMRAVLLQATWQRICAATLL